MNLQFPVAGRAEVRQRECFGSASDGHCGGAVGARARAPSDDALLSIDPERQRRTCQEEAGHEDEVNEWEGDTDDRGAPAAQPELEGSASPILLRPREDLHLAAGRS